MKMASEKDAAPIRWEQSDDGIVTLLLDAPNAPVNTITVAYIDALRECVDRLESNQDSVNGVIIRSAKSSFVAGGDLNRLIAVDPNAVDVFVADIDMRKMLTRRLELLRTPVVAIINGPVLGGGLELALACHHSIAIDDGRSVVGLPESTLGLIPGAGGIVRTVDRLGIDRALDEVVVPGTRFTLSDALEIGLVDEVVDTMEAAEVAATEWMAAHRENPQRQITRPDSKRRSLPASTAVPVARAITAAANAVLDRDFEAALHAESVAMGAIVVNPGTKNSIRLNFFDTGALRKQARQLSSEPTVPVTVLPLDASRSAAVASLAGRKVNVGEPLAGASDTNGADARLHLEAGRDAESPLLWVVGDTVGDGQPVVEYVSGDTEAAKSAIAGLASAGILPVPVREGGAPLSVVLPRALETAITERLADGVPAERITAALKWAGLSDAAAKLQTQVDASPAEVELAANLLDDVARAAVGALGDEETEQDAVISVRAGGFPSWTGGVREWLRSGRELARELARSDVAEQIESAR